MKAKYYIYRNLNKPGFFSIKHRGKVIAHLDHFSVPVAEFRVSQAGHQRVRREQQRNVHAYAVVDCLPDQHPFGADSANIKYHDMVDKKQLRAITYNPYSEQGSFVYKDTNEPITTAENLIFCNGKVWQRI